MQYKIQNVKDLEEILILQRAAEMELERYSKSGDYSVTDLINPPRICHLKRRHKKEIKPALESMISSMMGTALHEYYEKYLDMWADKHDYDGYTLEQQCSMDFIVKEPDGFPGKRTVSGRLDILEGNTITDLKTAKVWKLIFDPTLKDYHEQQNMYRYLLKKTKDVDIEFLKIVMVYKDWQKGNAQRDPINYPTKQMLEYDLSVWGYTETYQLMYNRLQSLVNTEDLKDDALPVCNRDERWERHAEGTQINYGIMKNPKAKRATKVVKGGTLDEAIAVANTLKGMTADSVIEIRYARPTRCIDWCEVAPFCNWYQDWASKNDSEKYNEYFKFKV